MARLRRQSPVGRHCTDDSDVDGDWSDALRSKFAKETLDTPRCSPRKKKVVPSYRETIPSASDSDSERSTIDASEVLKPRSATRTQGRQIRLAPPSLVKASRKSPERPSPIKIIDPLISDAERTPRYRNVFGVRLVRKADVENTASKSRRSTPREEPDRAELTIELESLQIHRKNWPSAADPDTEAEIEAAESTWCASQNGSDDSDSDEYLPSPRKLIHFRRPAAESNIEKETNLLSNRLTDLSLLVKGSDAQGTGIAAPISSRPASSSDKENIGAFLRFSPPRVHSPSKDRTPRRPTTPPQSPSKSRLQSPSKPRARLPTPPLRQSLDAFWNAGTVNGWNDQHSPEKILKSPEKLKFLRDEAERSPTTSPRKVQSPTKGSRIERDARKDFESRKRRVAEDFLTEVDRIITAGRVHELAATTGGVQLVWTKTLNSTAGRANWRKETTKTKKLDGTTEITYKHRASMELAEKVIDDESRLLNVLAHEFCHLANFMISGVKGQPHGRQFKAWGAKVTKAFQHRGVEVTTKHTYEIEYKYAWQCSSEDCAVEFKRHSKSIDPQRHTCGSCRSKLIQIKPAPRKDAGNPTGYAAYVKTNFAEVRRGLPGASQKEVMEAVGRRYRAEKAAIDAYGLHGDNQTTKQRPLVDVAELVDGLEVITIADD